MNQVTQKNIANAVNASSRAVSRYSKSSSFYQRLFLVSLLFVASIIPVTTHAADNDPFFIPSIGFGRSNLSFERTGSALPDVIDFANYFTLSLGGTVLLDPFFVNATVDIPLSDDTYYNGNGATDVSREDYNLTVGYAARDWLTTYVGYTVGLTDMNHTTAANYDFVTNHLDSGIFVGISMSKTFPKKGTLTFNWAYAALEGSIHTQTSDPAFTNFANRTASGPTTGFGYGLQWTFAGRGNSSYFAKLSARNYSFKPNRADSGPTPSSSVLIRRDQYSFSVGAIF